MKKVSKNKLFVLNFIASIVSTIINYGISFLFTPYLVRVAGSEAYGFVGLANNMVNYATIITIALSSVAGRFITIKFYQGKNEEANKYFNSVVFANIFIAVAFAIVSIPLVANLQTFISIPNNLINDVKLLFEFVVINFLITIVSDVFSVATFITNKLYLSSLGNCIASVIRVLLLWAFFGFLPTNIAYISITATICSVVLFIYNFILTKKLIPDIKPNIKEFSLEKIKELIGAGIWSSVTKLSQVLSDGLDLLISNIGVSSYAMGQLSIAYTIPTILSSVVSTVTSLFNPQQTYYYAKGDIKSVVHEIKLNMKLTGFFISVIFCGIVVYGYEFFKLWVPSENIDMIYTLSLLSIISVLVSGVATPLTSVFLLTNNLKVNSLVWLIVGTFDTIIVLIFVKFTSFGVYAVAGVSKMAMVLMYLTYLPVYAAKCLKISKKTFYPIIFRYIFNTGLMLLIFMGVKKLLPEAQNFLIFIPNCIILSLIGFIFNFIIFLNNDEKSYIIKIFVKKFKKI
ncbi:lipopolysaccharide biosynthesis protein [Clostridium guangxiense]|uniref:lipopolysaccharide biosynthesis protein n=1 Tax=Clostridium guangxiense TaxID=1662055 RepID=UPI001E31E3D4|nr:MATE family efflux transporter [Clostridium guangxiense]MCD2346259.1 MATE family efflux transporter [Clostridium guangxiense]